MDGTGMTVDQSGLLKTIWQRAGEVFISSSSATEEKISSRRSPSMASRNDPSKMVFSKGENIMSFTSKNSAPTKKGIGTAPKVVVISEGVIYFWVNY